MLQSPLISTPLISTNAAFTTQHHSIMPEGALLSTLWGKLKADDF
jgi:hypothetical protein